MRKIKYGSTFESVWGQITKIIKEWGKSSDLGSELWDWAVAWGDTENPNKVLHKDAIDSLNEIFEQYDILEGVRMKTQRTKLLEQKLRRLIRNEIKRIVESSDRVDITKPFAVLEKGSSIGGPRNGYMLNGLRICATFDTKAEAIEYAKRRRKGLSPGERSHYGMSYTVAPITKSNVRKIVREEIVRLSEDLPKYKLKQQQRDAGHKISQDILTKILDIPEISGIKLFKEFEVPTEISRTHKHFTINTTHYQVRSKDKYFFELILTIPMSRKMTPTQTKNAVEKIKQEITREEIRRYSKEFTSLFNKKVRGYQIDSINPVVSQDPWRYQVIYKLTITPKV